jgi:hypothetical protein
MKHFLRYSFVALLTLVSAFAAAEEVTFLPSEVRGTSTNGGADQFSKNGITVSCNNGTLGRDDNYRFFKSSVATISSTVGNITKVEFTCTVAGTEKYGPGCFTAPSVGSYTYAETVGTWTGDALSFTLTASSAQVRATKIVVTYTPAGGVVVPPTVEGEDGFMETATVTLGSSQDGAEIYYTLDGSTPTNQSTKYTAPFTISETTTVSAIAYLNGKASAVTAKTFNKAATYTVAEALAILSAGTDIPTSDVVITGIVSKIDEVNTDYGNATYYISDDGTTTSQLEVFRGYSLNGAKFTSQDELKVGDKVTVKGVIVNYKSGDKVTPEINTGSKIIERNGVTTGINRVQQSAADAPLYNLSGQRVDASYKGVVIKNGKKFVVR